MNKAARILSLVLCMCILLLGGLAPARAEVITVGIILTGMVPEEDGSFRSVTAEGDFRVFQSGREIGRISAGRTTLPVNNADRIRIEPVPQSFSPEWDLSTAYLTPDVSGTGTVLVPVTVYARKGSAEQAASTETNTAEPETQDTPEVPEIQTAAEPAATANAPVPTAVLTLPPYTEKITVTPEPPLAGLPESNETGSLRVQVFFDKNENGAQAGSETGVADMTVYLLDEAENALASAVTDGNGFAVFSNVPAGKYKTRISLPDNWYFTKYGGEDDIARSAYRMVPDGSQTSGVLAVYAGLEAQQGIGIHNKAAVMSGFIWLEGENDGLFKEGEAMVPGVTVRLSNRDYDELVYEVESGADGKWKLSHVKPGGYVMSVTVSQDLMLARYTQGRGMRSFLTSANSRRWLDLESGTVNNDANIGLTWAGQVYGRAYLDANYNGLYDEGELPLKGVRLTAKFSWDDAEAATVVSGEDGTFVLGPIRGNSYSLTATLPAGGYVFTKVVKDQPLGNRFVSRGAEQRATTIRDFTLQDAERVPMDIGVVLPGTVKGTVYYDDNFSATRDGKEKTVSGFQVTILDKDGNTAATDRSNARGEFSLTGLMPGEYSLEVTAVNGYAFTKTGEGNVILNRTRGAGYSETFRVELGATVTGMDVGMIKPGTVKGTVFADKNDNGVRDADEYGLPGVTVRLMSETEGEAFRAEIGTDGDFLFDAVMPGTYYVEYQLPETGVFARVAEGGNQIAGADGTALTARTASFAFATGDLVQAPLCGALTLGKIEGTAYLDHDGNGLMEGSEETAAGLTLRLIPSREDLETVAVTTGEDGKFLLERIRPDSYRLEAVCADGYVLSRTDYLGLPLKAGKQSQEVVLNVPMGAEWTDQKAGTVMPAAIRGQLWLDENNNGLFDAGERTPSGYMVTVTDEATGLVFDTPVTDAQGFFAAAGMIPGSFSVSIPLDEKTLAPKDGDSVLREENGKLILTGIELKENETREGLLAGVVRYTSISGKAWIDKGDQVEALGGLKVTMKAPDGSVIAETETAYDGTYRLDKLMPCEYELEVTAPEGHVLIEPTDPRLNETLRMSAAWTVNRQGGTEKANLLMDVDLTDVDFGCVLPGRLGDYLWLDLNKDGLQAGDEPGIAGVRIELLRDGKAVAETQTNEYGFYRFVDLYPATYTVKVYAPAEVKPTRRRTDLPMIASVLQETEETEAYSIPVTVESNRSQYNADLGFVCRKDGVLPAGAGTGAIQNWTPKY